MRKLKAPFTREFWLDRFEPSDDETLVDNKVLSYSYLEVGLDRNDSIVSVMILCCSRY